MVTAKTSDRLAAFLYTLMRDKLPVGAVTGIVREIEESRARSFALSDDDLAAIAVRHAESLRGGDHFSDATRLKLMRVRHAVDRALALRWNAAEALAAREELRGCVESLDAVLDLGAGVRAAPGDLARAAERLVTSWPPVMGAAAQAGRIAFACGHSVVFAVGDELPASCPDCARRG